MKKAMIIFMVLAALFANLAVADHEHICDIAPTGVDFGQHVSEHAQEGHFNGEMNPGVHHQGYSICVPE